MKKVEPSSNCKMIKLITFDNLSSPLTFSRRLSRFPAKILTPVHAGATLYSIGKISPSSCNVYVSITIRHKTELGLGITSSVMVNNAITEGSNIQEEVFSEHKPGKVMIALGPTSRWHHHHAMFPVNSNKPAYKVIFNKLQKKKLEVID